MNKTKINSILILVVISILLINSLNSVEAISHEGTTGANAGGPSIYTKWFQDFSGLLIVSSTFANGSGCEILDVSVIVSCINPNRAFRLRVWDSDAEQYINSENEVGLGTCERRFTVVVHMDTEELTWIAKVTDETGLIVFAEIKLYYIFAEGEFYRPVVPDEEIGYTPAEHRREVLYINISYFVSIAVMILFTGIIVLQREGTGVKSFIKSKVKSNE